MLLSNPRLLNALFFLGCSGLITTAIFIEPFKSMDPCPMCMMQRAVFILLAIVSFIAFAHGPNNIGNRIYATLTTVIALIGASVASRQLWLQSLPEDQVPACGPGIDYMLEVFPLLEVIEMAIRGTGDCAKVQWTLAGLSIPGWSLIAFLAIALFSLLILFKRKTS